MESSCGQGALAPAEESSERAVDDDDGDVHNVDGHREKRGGGMLTVM